MREIERSFRVSIEEALAEKSMSQAELAALCGVNSATISRYVAELIPPKPEVVRLMCENLDLDPIHCFCVLGWLPPEYASAGEVLQLARKAQANLNNLLNAMEDATILPL